MKKLLIFSMVLSLLLTGALIGQDELVVPEGENTLIDVIAADTTEDGEQAHDVYLLENGGLYTITETVTIKSPVTIKAENPVNPQDPDNSPLPPRVRSGLNEEGGLGTGIYIATFADITLKDIYFGGTTPDGSSRAWGHLLQVNEDNLNIHLDGIIWDYIGWSSVHVNGRNSTFTMENCKVRNASRNANSYCPWGVSFVQKNQGDVVLKNNSFYNTAGFVVKGRKMIFDSFTFDHNTIVNEHKWPLHYHWYTDAKITNNIFYNASSYGHDKITLNGDQDFDGLQYGLVNVDTLPPDTGAYSDVLNEDSEANRTVDIKNNAYFWSQGVKDYWSSIDSVQGEVWLNSRTEQIVNDHSGMVAENNVNQDPNFANVVGTDQMIEWAETFRSEGEGFLWGHEGDDDPGVADWPLPEDLSYSADLPEGTDGDPIGDINWMVDNPPTPTEDGVETSDFTLEQNYPNPFNPTTTIKYNVKNNSNVTLSIYNILGEKVKTLVNNQVQSGTKSVKWNATNSAGQKVSSGIYFYKLKTKNNTEMKKMMFMK